MGLKSSKSSLASTEYSLTLSSANNFYRNQSVIQGEFHLNPRKKLRIEKKVRVDLIGQLIETKKSPSKSNTNQTFFTYSFPLITTHQNGIARIIQQKQMTFPFRIPLGINLPLSCEFHQFSIVYFLDVYHDEKLLPNIRKKIFLAPPTPHVTIPQPCQINGSHEITIICSLQKSFYSSRDGSIVPLSVVINNPRGNIIQSLSVQLIQSISLNGNKNENEIFTTILNEIEENTQENQINRICELNLPMNLPATYIPNENGQPDNVPSIAITYEFRITAQMKGTNMSNLRLSVPIGIE